MSWCNSSFHTVKKNIKFITYYIIGKLYYFSLLKIVINSHNHPSILFLSFTFSDDDHSILVFIFYIQWWWSFRNLQHKQNSSIPAVTTTGLEGWEVIRGTRVVDRKLTPYRVSRTFSENLKTHASVNRSVLQKNGFLNIFLSWVLYGWRCLIIWDVILIKVYGLSWFPSGDCRRPLGRGGQLRCCGRRPSHTCLPGWITKSEESL